MGFGWCWGGWRWLSVSICHVSCPSTYSILLHTRSTSSMARHSSSPTVKTTRIKFTIVVPEICRWFQELKCGECCLLYKGVMFYLKINCPLDITNLVINMSRSYFTTKSKEIYSFLLIFPFLWHHWNLN